MLGIWSPRTFFLAILLSLGLSEDFYCGVPLKDRRVIGGVPAEDYQFPWQVSLYYYDDDTGFTCGGSIISDRTILTAAHCVEWSWSMYVGFPGGNTSRDNVMKIESRDIHVHPYYDPGEINYDFAVINLPEPIEFTEGTLPICLPCPLEYYDDRNATLSGWGRNNTNTWDIPVNLLYANVSTITNMECKTAYKEEGYDYDIPPNQICSTYLTPPPKGACHGDSGGPLITLEADGAFYTQIGIVSWGESPCADTPSVYARVTDQLYWIFTHMRGNTLPPPVPRPTCAA